MPDTVDRRLEHREPILAAARPSIPPKIVPVLIVFAALMIGITVTGLSAGFEWAPAQAPAEPIVCPGGDLVAGFDVEYAVNIKGVDFASACVDDGAVHSISSWWLTAVMTVEYTVAALLILFGWRLLWLRNARGRRSLATWSSEPAAAPEPGRSQGA